MTKLQTEIPEQYTPDWLEKLDGRTRIAQVVNDRLNTLTDDLGGMQSLSYQKRSLARRAIWMEAIIEQQEAALARGEQVDQGKLTQAVNSLIGLLKTLGLDRAVKDLNLSDYIASRKVAQ